LVEDAEPVVSPAKATTLRNNLTENYCGKLALEHTYHGYHANRTLRRLLKDEANPLVCALAAAQS